jgi:hypothetical protein
MRKPTKALVAVLLCAAVSVDADVVRTRGGGSATAAAVTPGTTTVTGCQNRVIYGDNSQVLNCEAALGYTASTDTLTAGTYVAGIGALATPSYAFAGFLGTGFSTPAGELDMSIVGTHRARLNSNGFVTTGRYGFGATPATGDTFMLREGVGIVEHGVDANAAPTPQTIKAHDGIVGTDVAGANLTLAGGRGTGAGTASDLLLQTGTALGTGTTAQALVTRNHIEGGFRALVDATATTVFTVTTGNDVACSGTAEVTVEAQDGTDVQATRAVISWAAVDTTAGAGGEACASGLIGTNVSAASSGTLTVTTDATTGTDLCNVRVTATGSLTETVGPRARYQVRMDPGSSTCAINPQ